MVTGKLLSLNIFPFRLGDFGDGINFVCFIQLAKWPLSLGRINFVLERINLTGPCCL
jgi:hypothetical protein